METKMKTHKQFMEEVEEATSLPSKTKQALGPESEKDFALRGNQE